MSLDLDGWMRRQGWTRRRLWTRRYRTKCWPFLWRKKEQQETGWGQLVFLKNGPTPTLFDFFRLFKHTLQFLQQLNVKNVHPRCWDSNSWPLKHESPTITTRPGLLFCTTVFSWDIVKPWGFHHAMPWKLWFFYFKNHCSFNFYVRRLVKVT